MPALTTQKVIEAGIEPTYATADVGGDTFDNDGRTILHIKNGDASPMTATVAALVSSTEKPGFGTLAKADAAITVSATDDGFLGPFPVGAFGPNPGIAYSAVTSVTIAVLRI